MKTKTVGWVVSLMLGVALLGASGGDDANGVASAKDVASDSADIPTETITTAPASAATTAAGHDRHDQASAPAKAKAGDDVQTSTSVKLTATPAPIEALGGACPKGMTEVEGDYCAHVEETCLRWLDPEEKMRCAEFAPGTRCEGKDRKSVV